MYVNNHVNAYRAWNNLDIMSISYTRFSYDDAWQGMPSGETELSCVSSRQADQPFQPITTSRHRQRGYHVFVSLRARSLARSLARSHARTHARTLARPHVRILTHSHSLTRSLARSLFTRARRHDSLLETKPAVLSCLALGPRQLLRGARKRRRLQLSVCNWHVAR